MKKSNSEIIYPENSSEQRFKLLAEASFEGIFVHNGRIIIDVNNQACKLFNYSRNRLIGTPLRDLISPSCHKKLIQKIEKDATTAYSVVALKSDGEPFTIDVRGKSLYMAHGKIRIVAVRDTTKQKENEQKLIFQYKLANLFQSEKTEQYTIRRFLHLLCTAYQFEIGEFYRADLENSRMVLAASWYEKSHSDLSLFMEQSKGTVFSFGSGFPGIVAETGKPIWTDNYENSPFVRQAFLTATKIRTINCIPFFMYGRIGGCYLLLSEKDNIQPVTYLYSTVSAQLGQYLEAQESRKQLLLANNAVRALPLLVYVINSNGQVLWSNKGGTGQIFCSGSGLRTTPELGDPVKKILRKGIKIIKTGSLLYRENLQCSGLQGPEGKVYEVVITPLEKNKQTPFYTITVADITERKKMEEALNQYSIHLEEEVHSQKQELSLAGEIQRGLLPEQAPLIKGWEIAARALPARSTGGDLYDFISYSAKTYYIVMADISGKGMSAALLTSAAKAIVREKIQNGDEPGLIVSRVNASMYNDLSHLEMFITLFILKIDLKRNTLTYANAGHTRTIISGETGKNPVLLPATCIPIGILPDTKSVTGTASCLPGSSIVLYSDGFTEAVNTQQELYGEERFVSLIMKHNAESAEQQVAAVFDEVTAFRESEQQSDDCTLVVLKSVFMETNTILQPDPQEADRLLSFIDNELKNYEAGLRSDMQLIAMELFTNILSYSLGINMETGKSNQETKPVSFVMQIHSDRIVLDFKNTGKAFDESLYKAPVLGTEQIGGYGIFLVRQVADILDYSQTGTENHWHIEKFFRRPAYAE